MPNSCKILYPKVGWVVLVLRMICPAVAVGQAVVSPSDPALSNPGPFESFNLPDAWEDRFWAGEDAKALLKLEPKALVDLVPVQAGLRYCRCPACDAKETDDPLTWSLAKPEILTCRACGVTVPNDTIPAKGADGKVPEEVVEVLPRVLHKYPYHLVVPEKQLYPDERLYLSAKRDYEIREFLSKAALYAAVRYHEQPEGGKDPNLAKLAALILLRFAQVYPGYATHYDQPGEPKFLQQADLKPPYRRGYRTAKWDWAGCLEVPLNLVIVHALIRDDPALIEAGKQLHDPQPRRTIERDLFQASAEFLRRQPEEFNESSLFVYRGMLAVGRLLGDASLVHDALGRLEALTERGFYFDGLWRQGDAASQHRVVGLIDGWIDRLLAGYSDPPGYTPPDGRRLNVLPGASVLPIFGLARNATGAVLADPRVPEVQQVAWPASSPRIDARVPTLLGGASIARLTVGQGHEALDLELRGPGDYGSSHPHRLALRLAVGGRPLLGDLDDLPPSPRGWERSTLSHNAVLVNGLNQREAIEELHGATPGSDVRFFAADDDFQVATLEDRFAYPRAATRYRQTILATASKSSRYAVAIMEVHGGTQHDQVFHASAGSNARWGLSVRTKPGPASLLPPMIPFVPNADPQDGRWFIQSYGEFRQLASGAIDRPAQAVLRDGSSALLRLHVLGDTPMWAINAVTPDPLAPTPENWHEEPGRASLILRRAADDGNPLKSTFVTLFEPGTGETPLKRVGRVASPEGTVLLSVETAEGMEHLLVNLTPGTVREAHLFDGRLIRTDGLAVRVRSNGLRLAGGTFAEMDGLRVGLIRSAGTIRSTGRARNGASRGWFETVEPLPDPTTLKGQVLIIRHGDGSSRGWTIQSAANRPGAGARIEVVEEPGFQVDPQSGDAVYYQFPRTRAPGPHVFSVSKLSPRK